MTKILVIKARPDITMWHVVVSVTGNPVYNTTGQTTFTHVRNTVEDRVNNNIVTIGHGNVIPSILSILKQDNE